MHYGIHPPTGEERERSPPSLILKGRKPTAEYGLAVCSVQVHLLPRALHPCVCWQHWMEGGHEGIAPVKSKKSHRASEKAGAESSYKTNSSCLASAQKALGAAGTAFEPGPGTCVHCQETDSAGQNVLRGILSTAITGASYTTIKAKWSKGCMRSMPQCVSVPHHQLSQWEVLQ